jgi:hypothetical protein
MTKVAVCISGGIKYPQNVLMTIDRIKQKDVKIFAHTWEINDLKIFKQQSNSYTHRMEMDFKMDYGIILNDLKNRSETFDQEIFDNKVDEFKELFNSVKFQDYWRPDLGVLSMHYSIHKCNQLKSEYEKKNSFKFDKVIRTRFDLLIENELDLDLYHGDLNIPEGEDHGGMNDRFAFGTSAAMDIYSSLYSNFKNLSKEVYHPETLLKSHLDHCGLILNRFKMGLIINQYMLYPKYR